MSQHLRRSSRKLRGEQLERRTMLAIDTYFINLDGAGPVNIFGSTGGADVQQQFIDHPLSIGGLINTNNVPGQNNRPPLVGDTTFSLSPGADQTLVLLPSPGVLAASSDPEGGVTSVTDYETSTSLGAAVVVSPDGSFAYDPRASHAIQSLDSGDTATDTLRFTVTDQDGVSASGVATIEITGSNNAPTIDQNSGAAVVEGASATLSSNQLHAGDVDDTAAELNYSVTSGPSNGQLERVSAPGTAIAAFTQADIDAGSIIYVHSGGENTADSFGFSLADGGEDGAAAATGTFSITVSPSNDAPVNTGVLPMDVSVTEDASSDVDLSGVTLSDDDGDALTMTLAAAGGTLAASSGGGVAVGGSGTGTLMLTGSAAQLNTFLDTATNIQYTGPADAAGDDADTINATVSDGGAPVNLGTMNVDIAGTDDPPSNAGSLPSDVTVTEETASDVDLSSIALADPDGGTLTLTIAADSGTLSATSGGGVTAGGSGTGTLTLTGTAADLNTLLDTASNVQYTSVTDVAGNTAATLSIAVSDGGSPVALGSVNVDITNVNDPPINAGTLPSDITVTEDVASPVDFSGVALSDVDGDTLTLTLTAGSGTLTAASGGAVTAGGSGTTTLTLTGTAAALNTFLDTPTDVQYTGPENASGDNADAIAVSLSDASATTPLGNVNVDISEVNDPPLIGVNLGANVNEGGVVTITTAELSEADPDDASIGLTYTITSWPANGQIELATDTGVAVTSFTEDDLENNRVVYRHDGSETTSDSFEFSLADGGESGSTAATGVFSLSVSPINDNPSNVGALPTDVGIAEDTLTPIDLSGITLLDADVGGGLLTVTLTAGSGTLAATSGSGVTAGGSGTSALTLTGALDDLNAFLDVSSNIGMLGAANLTGDNADLLTVAVNDAGNTGAGGGGDVTLGAINIDIAAINDDPTNEGTLPSDVAVVEDSLTAIDLSGITLADVDVGSGLMTVTLAAGSGTLAATSGSGVSVGGSGTDTLTLTGALADLNAFLDITSNIQLLSALNLAGDNADVLTISVNDGGNTGSGGGGDISLGVVDVDIAAVNDAPTNAGTLPSDISIAEDTLTAIDLSGITLLDVDAGDGLLTVTLGVGSGTLAASSGSGVTIGGSGADTLTLTGTLDDLNAYLDVTSNIALLGALNLAGDNADVLSVTVNDGGASGAGGGSDISLGTINIDIAAVNDDPINAGVLPTDVSVVEDTLTAIDLSGITIADVDVADGLLTLTLGAGSGTLAAASGGGVTAVGGGTDTLTLTGTLDNLNAYLDVTSNIQLLGDLDLAGDDADVLSVTINDGGGAGTGGGGDVSLGAINVDVAAINDAPSNGGTLPTNVSIVEDTLSAIDLSGITLLDVDAGDGLLTLTLGAGSGALSATSGDGVTAGGSGTDTLTLIGTLDDLNAYLDVTSNIQLLGALNLAGDDADLVTVTINDGGSSGSGGGGDISLGAINVDIGAVNDDPTNAGGLPSDLSIVTGLLSGIDLSSIEIADVDVADGLLTVTLGAGASDLSATNGGGVVIGGSGTDTLTLTGTLANLNAYLDISTNVSLFPGLGLLGEDVDLLSVTVNDGGGSGTGGGGDVNLGVINIDVLPTLPLVVAAADSTPPAFELDDSQLELAIDAAMASLAGADILGPPLSSSAKHRRPYIADSPSVYPAQADEGSHTMRFDLNRRNPRHETSSAAARLDTPAQGYEPNLPPHASRTVGLPETAFHELTLPLPEGGAAVRLCSADALPEGEREAL